MRVIYFLALSIGIDYVWIIDDYCPFIFAEKCSKNMISLKTNNAMSDKIKYLFFII